MLNENTLDMDLDAENRYRVRLIRTVLNRPQSNEEHEQAIIDCGALTRVQFERLHKWIENVFPSDREVEDADFPGY